MLTIAALNYWRGRGYDAPIRLNKIAFFAILVLYCLMMYNWIVATKLIVLFGIVFAVGTGGMMQAIHGKKQDKPEFKPINKILDYVFKNNEGRAYGMAFCTGVGFLQLCAISIFGLSWINISLLSLGFIIYLSKHWNYAEFFMALMWAGVAIYG